MFTQAMTLLPNLPIEFFVGIALSLGGLFAFIHKPGTTPENRPNGCGCQACSTWRRNVAR
jgi:hypothetical protein